MRFNPIGNEFAAVVEGINLCAPLNSAQVATIHAGMDRHAVLVSAADRRTADRIHQKPRQNRA
jgi:hypothetical protein